MVKQYKETPQRPGHTRKSEGGTGTALDGESHQIFTAPDQQRASTSELMEQICERSNLNCAYKRVKSNRGAPGVDGMTVEELGPWIRLHKEELIESLLQGTYKPQRVRGVEIPKAGGGFRQLGIPTVVDRLVQQAILQVLEPIVDNTFSDSSFGFRPKRSAHQALKQASAYVEAGHKIVVDIDLAKFFDNVNHDILMSRMARRIEDKRLLKLIRGFLQSGIMQEGVCIEKQMGTPQGGPLSPLLSNIMLDDLDKELEKRGHRFCRYADDCNIYVRTREAGKRVMESMTQYLGKKLKLHVNAEKSAVGLASGRKFLGYRIGKEGKLKAAPSSLTKLKNRVRELTRRNRGKTLGLVIEELNTFLTGWTNYFRHATAMKEHYSKLDSWIRHKLRCYRLKQRKRSYPIAKYLMELGVHPNHAWHIAKSSKGWWRLSGTQAVHMAMSNEWFGKQGLINLSKRYATFNS